jgi:predicted nuclease of predicted toxin-antitoxin system
VTILAALYIDEDMSALIATLLRSRGLDVVTVPEQATLGKTDRKQLEFAVSLGRCILTHNRVDFEGLHLRYIEENKQHSGIIMRSQIENINTEKAPVEEMLRVLRNRKKWTPGET